MSRGVVASLRDFVPIRPLTRPEAFRIAEMQANRFLKLVNAQRPPVHDDTIAELPRLEVRRLMPFPVSGATQWTNGQWLIVLNANEPETRQRFSLAHEFKHILDHRFIDILYTRIPAHDRPAFTEQLCDYFAGCLLVPRQWLKEAWGNGIQRPADLAQHFGVSRQAIQVRLSQTGLVGPSRRCHHSTPNWTLPPSNPSDTPEQYNRIATTSAP